MKILVIGDTHGKLNRVFDVLEKIKDIDLILHTGDYINDAAVLAGRTHIPIVAVPGNCDGSRSHDDYQVVDTDYGKILLVHGHMQDVRWDLLKLQYKAAELGCKAAVYGHTHVGLIYEEDGLHIVNPGSLTRPRDNSGGSFAIIRTTETSFSASIVYYDTIMRSPKTAAKRMIKSMLNYSDRF